MSTFRLVISTLTALAFTQVLASASTLTLTGPMFPATASTPATACTPGETQPVTLQACVVGNPLTYDIFSVSLTSPSTSGGTWHLDILTNYGATLPGGSAVVPTFSYEGKQFGMADFMIQQGSNFYAVIMTAHDGYTAGSLYQASGFQTAFQALNPAGVIEIPRPDLPALLKAGGSKIGDGTISAAATGGNGVTQALYKISVDFAAPIGFLSSPGKVTIYAASFVCDNGFITGSTDPFPPGHDTTVPEPPTWTLVIPAAVAIAMRKFRKS